MKGRQLLDAMAYIDDALIEEAAPLLENEQTDTGDFTARKRYHWKGIMACAAVFAVAVVSLWVWKSGIVSQERMVLDKGQNAGAYDTGGVSGGDTMSGNAPVDTVTAESAEVQDTIEDAYALSWDDVTDAAVSDGIVAEAENNKHNVTDDFAEESKGCIVRVIEEYGLPAEYCYKAPEKGSCLICAELKAAINYYDYEGHPVEYTESESYLYHVKIQVFGETDEYAGNSSEQENWQELRFSEEGKEKLCQEYTRMLSAGLDVSLSEDYELTGMLDHEEIENFVPYPAYGYAFQLINEN